MYRVVYNTQMKATFGRIIRTKRESLKTVDAKYSLRQVAHRIGIQPSFLSKIEREEEASLSTAKIIALANDLSFDPDELLALNGKISNDIQSLITKRPGLLAKLIRQLCNLPDKTIRRIITDIQAGYWQ